jgi:hypothetical protein
VTDTREDHLAWCRQRALEYVEANDPMQAFASMASDLRKHHETEGLLTVDLLQRGQKAALAGTEETRVWIEDIH